MFYFWLADQAGLQGKPRDQALFVEAGQHRGQLRAELHQVYTCKTSD